MMASKTIGPQALETTNKPNKQTSPKYKPTKVWNKARGSGTGSQSGHKENLNNLEGKVVLLGVVFHHLVGRSTGHLGHGTDEHRQEHHQDGQQDGRKQRGDQPQQGVRQVVDEPQAVDLVGQVGKVGDQTNKGNRDRPEDQHCDTGRHGTEFTSESFPPEHSHVQPDNVLWLDTNVLRTKSQGGVVGGGLVGQLGRVLRAKLDENGVHWLGVLMVGLQLVDFLVQDWELFQGVVDGVHLLTNEELQAVLRSLLLRNSTGSPFLIFSLYSFSSSFNLALTAIFKSEFSAASNLKAKSSLSLTLAATPELDLAIHTFFTSSNNLANSISSKYWSGTDWNNTTLEESFCPYLGEDKTACLMEV
ncbi:hypothetical protein WICPIJ_005704 [Wickerhamomyces pijperi]|uniref:Uncharacterized protein n=1 Tax=Wickerhamomyces pijperi TaxID=599730 RepID=A0A9P8Q320_WICPI|nr:hypothetical protein WICPIJ_005704 [Wickerhamomyces pijperi]